MLDMNTYLNNRFIQFVSNIKSGRHLVNDQDYSDIDSYVEHIEDAIYLKETSADKAKRMPKSRNKACENASMRAQKIWRMISSR